MKVQKTTIENCARSAEKKLEKVVFFIEMSLQMKYWARKSWFFFHGNVFRKCKVLRFCTFPETSWNFTLFQNSLSRTSSTYPGLQCLARPNQKQSFHLVFKFWNNFWICRNLQWIICGKCGNNPLTKYLSNQLLK